MLSEKIIDFYKNLHFTGQLPDGINIMNPFREDEEAMAISSAFYRKFYSDDNSRYLILGINPGRFGGGITGIPFTDPKRLASECEIPYNGLMAHEPSSVFVYEMIKAFGGVHEFYNKFLISAISPLGYTSTSKSGRVINYNYYDSKVLLESVYNFMIESLEKQIAFGLETDTCFCLGTGKNFDFIKGVNAKKAYFKNIIPLEHPRYIMQYKSKEKKKYIRRYIEVLSG
jgi:hypothetical protein